jgi:hydroxymethylglutaryl-CoA synthase
MFLQWKGFYHPDPGVRRPPIPSPSAPALYREQDKNIRFYGVKCRGCQTTQYPPQKVCTRCGSRGNFENVRLSDKNATLFTYSMDYIAGTIDVPLVVSVINFDGGGRALVTMTDRDIGEIKIGMPLQMSFRKLYSTSGIHNYYWKCVPLRV